MLMPLEGYEDFPLVSLEEAIEPLVGLFQKDLRCYAFVAKQNSGEPENGLTPDEAAAIQLYSMQWPPIEDSLFIRLNQALRATNREALRPWFAFLKLFLTALYKLPSSRTTVWRGVQGGLGRQYRKGQSVIWWGISSCAAALSVVEQFVGQSGQRTIFSIEVEKAKFIRHYSYFKEEDEIILLPGTYLKVVDTVRAAPDLTIIHMKEMTPPCLLIAPPWRQDERSEDFEYVPTFTEDLPDPVSEEGRPTMADEFLGMFRAWNIKMKLLRPKRK